VVGVILDAIPATSQCTRPQENTSAADVAQLRGQLTGMLPFVAQLIINFTCCSICKSLITTLLFWAHKVQAEDDGAR
jgi:hypothetical protein